MELLEIVRGLETDDAVVSTCLAVAKRIGKTPIVVSDTPGFATSRLGVAIGAEAMRMVESGVASVADIDRAMELGYRHPMGPLKLTDLVGLDVRLAILAAVDPPAARARREAREEDGPRVLSVDGRGSGAGAARPLALVAVAITRE
jgi:3-hydroxyacyl-CoA dehydrogenase